MRTRTRLNLLRGFAGLLLIACVNCGDPLRDQVSIQPHERPLRSVPAGVVPVDPARNPITPLEAENLTNPVPRSEDALSRGRLGYVRYCSHCHGELGRGWTSVGSSFDPAPSDVVEAVEGRTYGELFRIITFGSGVSPPLGPTISVEDRWCIIHYIETLGQAREGVESAWGQ